jgi:CubicO group peptidase (beta-lactamase class C family)
MKRVLVALLLFAMTLPAPVPAQPAPSSTDVQSLLDARAATIPGAGIAAALLDHGKLTTYLAGSTGTARPLDAQTLFEIGSVTKTFTATVLARMVLAEEVSLSDPVAKYLPTSTHAPSRDGKQITLLNLATQHSGLPRLPSNLRGEAGDDPYAAYTVDNLYSFLNRYKLTRDPGAAFEYSNLGFGLLGLALARRMNTSYEQLVRSQVLLSLGMNETALALTPVDRARFAIGHNIDGDVVHSWDFTDAFAGAGGIRSDLNDMVKYLRCNMGQGPLAEACLFAQQPRDTFAGHEIGLAWWTNTASHVIDHGGDTAGYHALVAMTADRSKGVVLLSSGPAITDIGAHMLDASYPVMPPAKTATVPTVQLDQYAGTYANAPVGLTYTVYRAGDKLYARITGQTAAVIYPSRPDHFYYRIVMAYIEFVRQGSNVVGLILTQGGRHIPVYRLDANGKPMAATLTPVYPPVVALDRSALEEYAGIYAILGTPTFTVSTKGGQVFFQVTGQLPYEIYPSARDEFYFKVVDAQVTFHRSATGIVSGLTLHQSGRDQDAKKQS